MFLQKSVLVYETTWCHSTRPENAFGCLSVEVRKFQLYASTVYGKEL